MKKWMWYEQIMFVNTLLKNENNISEKQLRNLYTKKDYRALLRNVIEIIKKQPNESKIIYRHQLNQLSDLLNKIETIIDKKRLAPGIVLTYGTTNNQDILVHGKKQEVIYNNTTNTFEKDEQDIELNCLFDLASTSKLFTAISILQLAQNNYLDLEKTIGDYLDTFPNIKDVKIIDLLTFNTPIKTDERIDNAKNQTDAENILKSIHPYQSNSTFMYTDMGCLILRFLIEKITGISLNEYIHNHIFIPCNMTSSFLNVPEDYLNKVVNENYSSIVNSNGQIITNFDTYPGKVHDPKANILGHNQGFASGHAGYFSSANDMEQLAINLLNRKLLNEEYLLMLGQGNNNSDLNTEQDGTKSRHGILNFTKQLNNQFLSVQSFLSGKSFIQPGFAGTTFCLDPLNNVYAFSATNRLHNRIYQINQNQDGIITLPSGERQYEGKTISSTFTKESTEIIKNAMEISLQMKLLEQYLNDTNELKLIREI